MKRINALFPKPQRQTTVILGVIVASIYILMILCQLLGFEKLPAIIRMFWPVPLHEFGLLAAALLVIVEVFSVPFLLGMRLSRLMRLVSAACAGLTVLYWLAAAIYSWLGEVTDFNTGFLGSYVTLPGGSWFVWLVAGIALLLGWYVYYAYQDAHLRRKLR